MRFLIVRQCIVCIVLDPFLFVVVCAGMYNPQRSSRAAFYLLQCLKLTLLLFFSLANTVKVACLSFCVRNVTLWCGYQRLLNAC